jgi:sugar phosphate isomerase/epimerase
VKLSFTTLGCPDWGLDEVIDKARSYGYDGVDFRGCAGEMDLWNLSEFSSQLDKTGVRLADAGLAVPCMSSSGRLLSDSDEARAESMENVARFVGIAERLGASYVRVFGGHNRERTEAAARREAAEILDEMARDAANRGVSILVETHDDWIATDKLAWLLDAAAEPNIGAIWDINHPFRMAGESPGQSWDNLARYVRYVHVKDTRRTDGRNQPVLLGEGEVPVDEAVKLLLNSGYDGWYACEWEKKWHAEIEEPDVTFPHFARYMRRLEGGEA